MQQQLAGQATSGPFMAGVLAIIGLSTLLVSNAFGADLAASGQASPQWLAGDHHVHSRYSTGWDTSTTPPTAIIGGDAIYPIPMNALMGRRFGLAWIVVTDHGGPEHSKVNLERAYPELLVSRQELPDIIQFYGMELNTPGADHSSLIIPFGPDEAKVLADIEARFDKYEVYPADPDRDTEAKMLDALRYMQTIDLPPVLIANHPSRSAKTLGGVGLTSPAELQRWNDTAPTVAVGMAGAPGHQAGSLQTNRAPEGGHRGHYSGYPTLGGFDQMTAQVGGFWDFMLGEGRHWWITANSDSHVHWTEGGVDFWPGEFSKTYVLAQQNHQAILASLRAGRVFVTTGDLVSELSLNVSDATGQAADIGGELTTRNADRSADLLVTIRVRDPQGANAHGDKPQVRRVDLIFGAVTPRSASQDGTVTDFTNPSAAVLQRFGPADWQQEGEFLVMTYALDKALTAAAGDFYLRVRGTSTTQAEPEPDTAGEDPWADLWFYSNPVFVSVDGDT